MFKCRGQLTVVKEKFVKEFLLQSQLSRNNLSRNLSFNHSCHGTICQGICPWLTVVKEQFVKEFFLQSQFSRNNLSRNLSLTHSCQGTEKTTYACWLSQSLYISYCWRRCTYILYILPYDADICINIHCNIYKVSQKVRTHFNRSWLKTCIIYESFLHITKVSMKRHFLDNFGKTVKLNFNGLTGINWLCSISSQEISKNGKKNSCSFELNVRSLRVVDQSQNSLETAMQMWATFNLS